MDTTATPATQRKLDSRNFRLKLLCEWEGAAVEGNQMILSCFFHYKNNDTFLEISPPTICYPIPINLSMWHHIPIKDHIQPMIINGGRVGCRLW